MPYNQNNTPFPLVLQRDDSLDPSIDIPIANNFTKEYHRFQRATSWTRIHTLRTLRKRAHILSSPRATPHVCVSDEVRTVFADAPILDMMYQYQRRTVLNSPTEQMDA